MSLRPAVKAASFALACLTGLGLATALLLRFPQITTYCMIVGGGFSAVLTTGAFFQGPTSRKFDTTLAWWVIFGLGLIARFHPAVAQLIGSLGIVVVLLVFLARYVDKIKSRPLRT